jgi:hypothetical protein
MHRASTGAPQRRHPPGEAGPQEKVSVTGSHAHRARATQPCTPRRRGSAGTFSSRGHTHAPAQHAMRGERHKPPYACGRGVDGGAAGRAGLDPARHQAPAHPLAAAPMVLRIFADDRQRLGRPHSRSGSRGHPPSGLR